MKWLLNVYPPAWQRRYRHEMETHLQAEQFKLRTVLDLMAGAADAWLNPGWTPKLKNAEGDETMITVSRCGSASITKAEALRSAAWMLGLCLVLSGVATGLIRAFGQNIMASALLYSAFFIAFTVSSRHTYLKPYSRTARNVLTIAGTVGWYLFFLGVAALAAIN